jgi:DNA mismatch repair protein MutH
VIKARPPEGEAELLARAHRLAGITLGELATTLEAEVRGEPARRKGLVGMLVEAALGATAGSRSEPDFPHLGVELKTIPMNAHGKPQESTFVSSIPLNEVAESDFECSSVWKKLARVLFVPVEHEATRFEDRRLGTPLLWVPSAEERALLEADWELFAGLIGEGAIDRITAHLGEALQVRPKAADASARRLGPDALGGLGWTLPRAFYLRARFTEGVIRRVLMAG